MYFEDIELMFATQSILLGEPAHNICSQIYGNDMISGLKRKYHFLCEVFKAFGPNNSSGMFEHLLAYSLDQFSLSQFRDHLMNLETAVFIKQHLCLDYVDMADIKSALSNDKDLETLYFELPYLCNSYLGFQSFFRQTKRYISEYFAFTEELRTEAFAAAIRAAEPDIMRQLENARAGLGDMPPLEYSQQVMGKTFQNRGPYASFTFSPSLLMPYRAVRFFGTHQILFFTIRSRPLQDEEMLKQLKVIADTTRYRIISLLGEKGPLRGMDIAEELSVAPSTISHHMEQLKKAGLLHEEQVKNSKYYSISKNNVKELLKRLTETLVK